MKIHPCKTTPSVVLVQKVTQYQYTSSLCLVHVLRVRGSSFDTTFGLPSGQGPVSGVSYLSLLDDDARFVHLRRCATSPVESWALRKFNPGAGDHASGRLYRVRRSIVPART